MKKNSKREEILCMLVVIAFVAFIAICMVHANNNPADYFTTF